MASNKDILDAQRFNRRRLVTAFVAGAPGGRELEPRSVTRPLIGGVVLSLVILLVSWASGFFTGSLPENWENNTLVMVKGEGTRYLTINGRLRPVTNLSSARLLSEAGSFTQTSVNASQLKGIERGTRVGIEDAPEELPDAGALTAQGWTACSSADGGTATTVGARPAGLSPIQHAVVSVDDTIYVVADGVSHEIGSENTGVILLALGLDDEPVLTMDATWLNLFSHGSPIEPFSVPEAGQPVTGLSSTITRPVAGMILSVTDPSGAARYYLVNADSSLTQLSEVSKAMYDLGGGAGIQPQEVLASDLSQVTLGGSAPADWPESFTSGLPNGSSLCAVLTNPAGGPAEPTTTLGSAGQVNEGGLTVAGGSGALVRSSDGGTLGPVFLITDTARAWGLGGDVEDTIKRLGYADTDIATVPSSWLALFPVGAELSSEAAWKEVPEK